MTSWKACLVRGCLSMLVGGAALASTACATAVDSEPLPGDLDQTAGVEDTDTAEQPLSAGKVRLWDDFQGGFTTGTPDAKWFYFGTGPVIADDGIETTSRNGLRVVSSGVNAVTGEPAFTKTLGQEDENGGLPGVLDHVKWVVFMNHFSSHGYPGFDTADGKEVGCKAIMGGRTYGTAGHPFGDAIVNPEDNFQLAGLALNSIDYESWFVFDFIITNQTIYALYERLPFGRATLGNYAAFTYAIPVASTRRGEIHDLQIGYDKARGQVRWFLDGNLVYTLENIGYRLPSREFMMFDFGGTEGPVELNQLDCGLGMFSILDAHLPARVGLVRLSNLPNFYFNPEFGEPVPETFLDDESLPSNRLFGQGGELKVRRYYVYDRPAR